MLIGLVARGFWFNPVVAALKRQAILAIESGCDEACARLLGRKHYRKTLARLVLVGQTSSGSALAPALRSTKLDLMRLELLAGNPRMDGRAWAAVIFMFAAGACGAALGAAAPDQMSAASNVSFANPSHYGYDVPPTWSLD
jgi:beta-lactamase regulating signal transducer with metallopeptidase domain